MSKKSRNKKKNKKLPSLDKVKSKESAISDAKKDKLQSSKVTAAAKLFPKVIQHIYDNFAHEEPVDQYKLKAEFQKKIGPCLVRLLKLGPITDRELAFIVEAKLGDFWTDPLESKTKGTTYYNSRYNHWTEVKESAFEAEADDEHFSNTDSTQETAQITSTGATGADVVSNSDTAFVEPKDDKNSIMEEANKALTEIEQMAHNIEQMNKDLEKADGEYKFNSATRQMEPV